MTIVCLGDSLTYGYAVRRRLVWVTLAGRKTGLALVNRGVNGLMTAGMLGLFNREVAAASAGAVLLMGGANDILSGLDPAEPLETMREMIRRAREAGILPLVGIPPPFCPPIRKDWAAMADFPAMTPVFESYVGLLRSLCAEINCAVVDFREGLADRIRKTGLAACSFYGDGVHMNEAGHRVFADVCAAALREHGLTGTTP